MSCQEKGFPEFGVYVYCSDAPLSLKWRNRGEHATGNWAMLNGTNEKRKIVVVEDNMIVSMELRDRLQRHGYEVTGFASRGEEAVEICLRLMPDLVLMDVILDGNMTGIEAVAELQKKADIPVIYLTAFSDRDTVGMAKNTTPYGYLIKPIDERELFVTIEMAFARLDFQRKIEESELKFRNLFEDSRDAIYIQEIGGDSDFNDSMLDLFGYSDEEMKTKTLVDFFADRNDMLKYLEIMKSEGYVKNLPVRLKKKNGAEIMCITSTRAIKNVNGAIKGFQGIIRDITDIQMNIERLNSAMNGFVRAMSMTLEVRDPYTAGHQKRVAELSVRIGGLMGISVERLKALEMSALIHDFGKINVPYEILNKPGLLSTTEFDLIRAHSRTGYDILRTVDFPWPLADIVHQHHERIDGSGYPEGLSGGGIMLEAKIIAVSDVVESMASHRPYRPARGIEAAMDEIKKFRGVLFEPEIVDLCVSLFLEKGFRFEGPWHG